MFQFSRGHSFAAFITSLTLAYVLTPQVRKLALRIGAVDRPKARKVHSDPTPTLGGLAIFAAFAMGALVANGGLHGPLHLNGIFLGCTLVVAVGLLDDLYDLPALAKLSGQIVAAMAVWTSGIQIDGFADPRDGQWIPLLPWQSAAITVLWIVSITNTINLIDGLDGLAAGVSAVSSAALGLIAMQIHNAAPVATLAAATCGAALGFLRHNFNPAKIFMGDTGSQLLGLLLAVISIRGPLKTVTAAYLFVVVLALGVPVFDTSFAILRRLANRRPIHHADRGHLHHRLVDCGLSQRQAVVIIYAVSCLLCAAALVVFRLV